MRSGSLVLGALLAAVGPVAGVGELPGQDLWVFEGPGETWNGLETGTGCAPFVPLHASGRVGLLVDDRPGPEADALLVTFTGEWRGVPVPCAIVRSCLGLGDARAGWSGRCADPLLINEWTLRPLGDGTWAFVYRATAGQPAWFLSGAPLTGTAVDRA